MQVKRVGLTVVICSLAVLSGSFGQEFNSVLEKSAIPIFIQDTKDVNTVSHDNNATLSADDVGVGVEPTSPKPKTFDGTNTTNTPSQPQDHKTANNTKTAVEKGSKKLSLDAISVKVLRAEENCVGITDIALNKESVFTNFTHMKTFSVDYHYKKSFMFLAANDKILRYDIIGKLEPSGDPKLIIAKYVDGPVSIAVDWVNDKLYWSSTRHNIVEMSNLDGTNRNLVIDIFSDILYPNNIVVDPYERLIFIVSNHTIYRATLDGKELNEIQLNGREGRAVKCVTVDTNNKRIFYTGKDGDFDKGQPYLASCDYEGQNVKEHFLGYKWNDIFSLSVFRNILYFGHYPKSGADTVWSIDFTKTKPNPEKHYTVNETDGSIWGIRVFHPEVQENKIEVSN